MTTCCIFPAELICQILCHTSVRDVVRWRVVSKSFCAITHDPTIWDALYEHAPFPRPPGPFHNAAFKSAFLQSARLAQSWTTKPVRKISRFEVPFSGVSSNPPKLIGGRWFIVYQARSGFVLYDTDARDPRLPQVLWEKEGAGFIEDWNEYSTALEDGNYVVYVFLSTRVGDDSPQWSLLEFRLDADSGALISTNTLDVPMPCFSEEPLLHNGRASSSRYLVMPTLPLVFDMRTRTFYEFPEFRLALDETKTHVRGVWGERDIVVTDTHVIVFRNSYLAEPSRPSIFVQAFTLPDDQHPSGDDGFLCLSHEGVYKSRNVLLGMIRNSIVDPSTGDINVKLLERDLGEPNFHIACVDLMLHRQQQQQQEVSGITIEQQIPFIIGNMPPNLDGESIWYDHVSDNGYARGLYIQCNRTSLGGGIIMGFTIDATQPRCKAVLSEHMAEDWIKLACQGNSRERNALTRTTLDGVRGRMAYEARRSLTGNDRKLVVVVDVE